jgi:hypothetical protein
MEPPEQTPPPLPGMPVAPPPTSTTNGLAVASLVCGILAVVLFFSIVFPIILGILAVIFGAIGIGKANNGASGKGLAIAGIVCGVLGVALAIAFIALFTTTSVEIIHSFSPSVSPIG